MKPFIDQVGEVIKDHWDHKSSIMEYETVFLFSELNETRDNIPQKAHVDLGDDLMKFEKRRLVPNLALDLLPLILMA